MDSSRLVVRHVTEADAELWLALARRIDDETRFMIFEPGERKTTVEEQAARFRAMQTAGNQTMFLAEVDGEPVGYLGAMGGNLNRVRHKVLIFIGIRAGFQGKGIGTALFTEMEAWARSWGAHRLELTVMPHNAAGLALYRKMGFEIEGTLRHALRVDGVYVDEITMAKVL
jgi:RimJ/RimL family protein N-acetyltransferase